MENKYYIYFHVNLCTAKVFYVGKGKDRRAWSKYRRNKHWHNTVNKYGYDVQIFEEGLTEQEAFEREVYWITYFGRENLVNLTNGGEGVSGNIPWNKGVKTSEKTLKKISESLKGRTVWNKGRKHSNEVLKKMSEIKKGKKPWNKGIKRTEEEKRKMSEARMGINKGVKRSEETIRKIIETKKNKKLNYGN